MFNVGDIVYPTEDSFDFVNKRTSFVKYKFDGFYVAGYNHETQSITVHPWTENGNDVLFDVSSQWHISHFQIRFRKEDLDKLDQNSNEPHLVEMIDRLKDTLNDALKQLENISGLVK